MGALPVASGGAVAAISALAAVVLVLAVIAVPFVLWARHRRLTPEEQAEASAKAAAANSAVEPNVVALFTTVGAAILGIVAVFLPALESEAFSEIKQNTLIQKGTGFFVIGVCVRCSALPTGSARRARDRGPCQWVGCS
jgi:hypothetical protein